MGKASRSFKATLEKGNPGLGWVIVQIPFDAAKAWGSRGMLKVRGEINGFAFRTSLFPTGQGGHTLLVNKKMQKGANVAVGGVARFRLEPDTEERIAVLPEELKRLLAQDRVLRQWVDALGYGIHKEITDSITEVKSAEARERRAEQIAERLMLTMEGEQELPPILRVAFARQPLARKGWEQMSVTRQRRHLLGIYYYRTPEARERRVEKVVQDALRVAKGKGTRERGEGNEDE